ncbi:hypothetical protein IFR05_001206 [Cadophora sp. M221]|nr:hypothetical protein IFR05_001206 [Cadophora sp. M221]
MLNPNPLLVGAISAISTAIVLKYLSDGFGSGEDPDAQAFHQQLGDWASLQPKRKQQHPPLGPQINATLAGKFCDVNNINLSRIPQGEPGTSSWSIVLAVIRKLDIDMKLHSSEGNLIDQPPATWLDIPLTPFTNHEGQLGVKISRATLMTLFALTNARRGDVYPTAFPARVDKCVEMMAGIISDGEWKIAFSGHAKYDSNWVLEERVRGFGGAHGSRYLYNMQGGRVFDVDLLVLVPGNSSGDMLKLQIPCLQGNTGFTYVFVAEHEASLLASVLDCLPWSSLSWSLHRGLKDVLLAYGKPTMSLCRKNLADVVEAEILTSATALIKRGWEADFVRGPMAGMAASAILSGVGNSGDLVRIVTAAAECMIERMGLSDQINLDRTSFWKGWRQGLASVKVPMVEPLKSENLDEIVALTKFFVLEWSQRANQYSHSILLFPNPSSFVKPPTLDLGPRHPARRMILSR